jgi:hypothetical protein
VFSFQDDDEQWLSLRYDLTAPLARYVAETFDALPKPYRSYRAGWVFRNEKPGPGRFRQFMQFDADTVGAASIAADAEICMMAADTMEALGIRARAICGEGQQPQAARRVLEPTASARREAHLAPRPRQMIVSVAKACPIAWEGRKDSQATSLGCGLNDEQIQASSLWRRQDARKLSIVKSKIGE